MVMAGKAETGAKAGRQAVAWYPSVRRSGRVKRRPRTAFFHASFHANRKDYMKTNQFTRPDAGANFFLLRKLASWASIPRRIAKAKQTI